ncbi:hypothetical protein COOONC_00085 [Cooperia oncophora]
MQQYHLEGIRQQTQGLCHISQLKNERVNSVADVLNRGQRVKVKVIWGFLFHLFSTCSRLL